MTDQQPHTPTKGDLKKAWDWYRADQDKEAGIPQNFRTYRFEFLRAWDAIEAAAEQRGAERALVDAAKTLREVSPESATPLKNMPGNVPVYIWLAHRAEKYRTDLLEGDDGQS